MKCTKCGYDILEGTSCPVCGYENSMDNAGADAGAAASFDAYAPEIPIKPVFPMKWYKALLVLMWIGAVLNVLYSVTYFTGSSYEGNASLVYATYPTLKTLDMLAGVSTLLLSALQIVTWYRLKEYKKNGPMLLTVIYAWNIVFGMVYSVTGYYVIVGSLDGIASSLNYAAIFAPLVFLICNHVYFKRRAELFVN